MINISTLVSTMFGLGNFTKFPGTLCSFIVLFPIYIVYHFLGKNFIYLFYIISLPIAFYSVEISLKKLKKKDPKEIVVDEYIGQYTAILFCTSELFQFLVAFILFRFFDILKPFPINFFDKINNSFGIIFDDIVAGIISGLIILLIFNFSL